MNAPPPRDTIFALSSGAPPAAIAVMRVSGPAAASAIETLVGRLPPPRRATLATVRDAAGRSLDRGLILWFPGVGSATGEPLAELHLHGGKAVVAAVAGALAAIPGCRPAVPGEFTRRAFENGRLDLAEAEGLADLLAAETEDQRRRALRAAEGGLSRQVEQWRTTLLTLSARVEAEIEFGEEEADVMADPALSADIGVLAGQIEDVLADPPAERLRDGYRIVVAGPVNSGKSTLINVLAEREVSITASIAGTTRDIVEAPVLFAGQPCILIDSAGLRETSDIVEQVGVARAYAAIEDADLLLWLGDPSACSRRDATIRIHARRDQPGREVMPPGADIAISAVTGEGMAALRKMIGRCIDDLAPRADASLFNLRQRAHLRAAATELRTIAVMGLGDPLLVAEHLRAALGAIDAIVGRAGTEEMLDALFGRFCIGK